MQALVSIVTAIISIVLVVYNYQPGSDPVPAAVSQRPVPIMATVSQRSTPLWDVNHMDIDEKSAALMELLKAGQFKEVDEFLTTISYGDWLNKDGIRLFPSIIGRWWREREGEKRPFPQDLERYLVQWVEQYPQSAVAWVVRGRYYYNLAWHFRGSGWAKNVSEDRWQPFHENIKKARLDLTRALEIDPTQPHAARYLVALSRVDENIEPEMASSLFMAGAGHLPGFYGLYKERLIGLMPKWGGNWKEMFDFARHTAHNAPRGSILPILLVNAHEEAANRSKNKKVYLSKTDHWKEIQLAFEQVLGDFPQSTSWRAYYARQATSAGKLNIAQSALAESRGIDPDHYESLLAECNIYYYYTHNWPALEKSAKHLGHLYPTCTNAFFLLGQATMRQQRYKEAIAAFTQALEIDPSRAYTWMNRGTCFYELRQYQEAIADFDQTLARDRRSYAAEWAYNIRAKSHARLGNTEQAEADGKAYIELKKKRAGQSG